MASNKYFNFYNQRQEQKLLQDLVEESIKIHAIDAIYIPRSNEKIDPLFREDPLSQFTDYHHLEVYIKNVDGFEGDGNIFRKFGLDIKNQITFSISRASFAKTFGKEMSRPKEGDLIYLPMSLATALYEIRFVAEESVFYNLGQFYVFDLQCEQYAFQDENVSTGIKDLDDSIDTGSQIQLLSLASSTGLFSHGDYLYQGDSLLSAKSRAKFVDYVSSDQIKIKDVYGTFLVSDGPIKGSITGFEAVLLEDIDTLNIQDDFGAKNKDFIVIDFTETNPFSEDE